MIKRPDGGQALASGIISGLEGFLPNLPILPNNNLDGPHPDGPHLDGPHLDGPHLDGSHPEGQHPDGQHPGGQHHSQADSSRAPVNQKPSSIISEEETSPAPNVESVGTTPISVVPTTPSGLSVSETQSSSAPRVNSAGFTTSISELNTPSEISPNTIATAYSYTGSRSTAADLSATDPAALPVQPLVDLSTSSGAPTHTTIFSQLQNTTITAETTSRISPTVTASILPSATPVPKSSSVNSASNVLIPLLVLAVFLALSALLLWFVRRHFFRPGAQSPWIIGRGWLKRAMNVRQRNENNSQCRTTDVARSPRVSLGSNYLGGDLQSSRKASFQYLERRVPTSSDLLSVERESPDQAEMTSLSSLPSPLISEGQELSGDMEIYNQRNGLGIYGIGLSQTAESSLRGHNNLVARVALAPAPTTSFVRTANI